MKDNSYMYVIYIYVIIYRFITCCFFKRNLLIEKGSQLTFITASQAKKLHLRSIQQVPLILYDFKGLSNYSTEPSYYDIVYFLLHGVNGGRITSSCGAQRNCRTFRRSSSSCAHNTVSSLTSSISSYRIN